jgi:hypothetical protein
MRRPTPPRERRGGTCPPARPGGSYKTQSSGPRKRPTALLFSSYQLC